MVCPYCSTNMEPIELNGKVFCSNCGLTIANNVSPTETSTQNTIIRPNAIGGLTTDAPDEVEFPLTTQSSTEEKDEGTTEATDSLASPNDEKTIATSEPVETPSEQPIYDPFGQLTSSDQTVAGVKVPVTTSEIVADQDNSPSWSPITNQAKQDLGIMPSVDIETVDQSTSTPEPVFESRIPDVVIPSEEDFDTSTPNTETTPGSFIELANPGDEKSALEASGILLDILGEEKDDKNYPSNESEKLKPDNSQKVQAINPVLEPEIPTVTETKEEDDIYKLPAEIKVGLRNKKIKKEISKQSKDDTKPDAKTEKKIESLEKKIAEAPVPVVDLTPEEAKNYDPDTMEMPVSRKEEKSQIIKDYFSSAIEKDKTTKKAKKSKKEKQQSLKILLIFTAIVVLIVTAGVGSYLVYRYYQPANRATVAKTEAKFDTMTPSVIPDGYALIASSYNDSNKTYEMSYAFANDTANTIVYRQIKSNDTNKYVSDYLLANQVTYTIKEVNGRAFTEVNKNNLLWSENGFAFVIETKNYTLSNDLLYKMAESVQ